MLCVYFLFCLMYPCTAFRTCLFSDWRSIPLHRLSGPPHLFLFFYLIQNLASESSLLVSCRGQCEVLLGPLLRRVICWPSCWVRSGKIGLLLADPSWDCSAVEVRFSLWVVPSSDWKDGRRDSRAWWVQHKNSPSVDCGCLCRCISSAETASCLLLVGPLLPGPPLQTWAPGHWAS